MKDPCLHLLVICDAIYVIPFWRKHDFTTWISTSNIKLEIITFSIRLSKYLVNPCYVVKLNSSRWILARKNHEYPNLSTEYPSLKVWLVGGFAVWMLRMDCIQSIRDAGLWTVLKLYLDCYQSTSTGSTHFLEITELTQSSYTMHHLHTAFTIVSTYKLKTLFLNLS